jgi:hypothetical protein
MRFVRRDVREPHRLSEKRPRSFVSALPGFAAVERSRNHLSRDFRGYSIFDFCNTIVRITDQVVAKDIGDRSQLYDLSSPSSLPVHLFTKCSRVHFTVTYALVSGLGRRRTAAGRSHGVGTSKHRTGPYSNARKKAAVPDPGSKLISYNFVRAAAREATQSFEKDNVNFGVLRARIESRKRASLHIELWCGAATNPHIPRLALNEDKEFSCH